MSRRRGPSALTMVREGVVIAFDAILANRLRAGLTVLGVGIGVSVVVTMAALITGIRGSVLEAFESAGPNNFIVVRFDFTAVRFGPPEGRPPWLDNPVITPEEAVRVGRLPAIDEALYNFQASTNVEFESQQLNGVTMQGYSSGWPKYAQGDFIAGRDFTPAEVRESRNVIVVSSGLALDLFGQLDPIGRSVRLSTPFRDVRDDFRVIGVFEPEENVFTAAVEHWIVMPYSTGLKRLKADDSQAQILVVPDSSYSLSQAQDEVIGTLRSSRGLRPADENDFALLASAQLVDTFNRLTAVFFLVMLALSSAGLLVGGVGVIGIMLISVTERTREIGVRKALGATRREILWQFLVEAGVLTALGGAAGLILGAILAYATAAYTPIPAEIPLWSVGVALASATLTGMLFGLLPAYRAARLEPVEAFRAE